MKSFKRACIVLVISTTTVRRHLFDPGEDTLPLETKRICYFQSSALVHTIQETIAESVRAKRYAQKAICSRKRISTNTTKFGLFLWGHWPRPKRGPSSRSHTAPPALNERLIIAHHQVLKNKTHPEKRTTSTVKRISIVRSHENESGD